MRTNTAQSGAVPSIGTKLSAPERRLTLVAFFVQKDCWLAHLFVSFSRT